MPRIPWHLHADQSRTVDRIRPRIVRTKDQHLFSVVPRHPVNQPDLLLEVMKVRGVEKPAIQDFGAPGRCDGDNCDGFPLIDG